MRVVHRIYTWMDSVDVSLNMYSIACTTLCWPPAPYPTYTLSLKVFWTVMREFRDFRSAFVPVSDMYGITERTRTYSTEYNPEIP